MANSSNIQAERVVLFGGSFDPPHIGHAAFCRALAGDPGFDAVWIQPSYRHPFDKEMAPFELRMEMCRIAFDLISPKITVRADEKDAGGTGYTIELLRYLISRFPKHHFTLALGADNYDVRDAWKEFDEIERMVEVKFYGRRGYAGANEALSIGTPFPELSSSDIRDAVESGRIPEDLLPAGIGGFIRQHRLYQQ